MQVEKIQYVIQKFANVPANCHFIILLLGDFFSASAQVELNSAPQLKENIQTTITYCKLPDFHFWRNGNLFYSFTIDQSGKTANIKNIRNDNISEEKVKSCISKWEIKGVPNNSPFVVYFEWKYGRGWTEQRIGGTDFSQTIKIDGTDYDYPNQTTERHIITTYCNPEIFKTPRTAETDISLLYSFKINKNGKIIKVKRINDDYVGEGKIKLCISGWKIFGFPKQNQFNVSFNQEKDKNQFEQIISGGNFSQTTKSEITNKGETEVFLK